MRQRPFHQRQFQRGLDIALSAHAPAAGEPASQGKSAAGRGRVVRAQCRRIDPLSYT